MSASGGLLSLTLDDPGEKRQALVDLSVGSYAERRAFMRLESGLIGATNLRAFVSYSFTRADNWRGAGFDLRRHVDAKLLNSWGAAVAPACRSPSTMPTTACIRARRSPTGGPPAAATISTPTSPTVMSTTGACIAARSATSTYPRRCISHSAAVCRPTARPVSSSAMATRRTGPRSEPPATPSAPSCWRSRSRCPVRWAARRRCSGTTRESSCARARSPPSRWKPASSGSRPGSGALRYRPRRAIFTGLKADGHPIDAWGRARHAIRTADGRLLALQDIRMTTVTKGFFVADQIAIMPRVQMMLGFKGVDLLHHGRNMLPGPQRAVRSDSFAALPRASLQYRLERRQQLFANITTHFRPPNEFTLYDSYDGAGGISSTGNPALKNEYSISLAR